MREWVDTCTIDRVSPERQRPGDERTRAGLLDADTVDLLPFELTQSSPGGLTLAKTRLGQQQFKFRIFQRYGPSCAVCGLNIGLLFDAAHIRPRRANGSDDPRSGLVLCALNHRALDSGFFAVESITLLLYTRTGGPDRVSLRILHSSLAHLVRKPHTLALEMAVGLQELAGREAALMPTIEVPGGTIRSSTLHRLLNRSLVASWHHRDTLST